MSRVGLPGATSQRSNAVAGARPGSAPVISASAGAAQAIRGAIVRHLGIVSVTVLTTILNLYRLNEMGYSNLYYAASVRSMLIGWRNVVYASFDPGGFVSVDKPPLGFWIQALSAKIFGFSGVSILLPQALAGILSVIVLYLLVRRTWGELAGVLAALFLTLSPINVVTSRNNAVDSQLLFVLLLAAWAVTRATEGASRSWLIVGFGLVGVGFNIKMLQAFLVLPAFYAVYLFAVRAGLRKRMIDLVLATAVLAVVSLSWIAVVDLTPASQRPYVGASGDNHVISLVLDHNGASRLAGSPGNLQGRDIGDPGILRFLDRQFAEQISWYLPLAFAGFALLLSHRPWRSCPATRRYRTPTLLWGGWLFTFLVFFSVAGFFHLYYLAILSPAIAVLAAIAVSQLLPMSRQPGWQRYLLLTIGLGTLVFQFWILSADAIWWRLVPLILGLIVLAILIGIASHFGTGHSAVILRVVALTISLTALLVGPAVWATIPVLSAGGTVVPLAGPIAVSDSRAVSEDEGRVDPRGVAYLEAHRGNARYLVATLTSFPAAPLIVATGEPVMTLGGWKGRDNILSVADVEAAVVAGEVRFFLLPGGPLTPADRETYMTDHIRNWVLKSCQEVPDDSWRSHPSTVNAWSSESLYDCTS